MTRHGTSGSETSARGSAEYGMTSLGAAKRGKSTQGFQMDTDIRRIKVPAGHSVTTAKLIELLQKPSEIGDTLSDEALTAECGKATGANGDGYASLMSAIRYVRAHNNIVWARVHGADAIKRLCADEIADVAERSSSMIRRAAKATVSKLSCVEMGKVDEKDRPRFTSLIAQHGALAAFAKSDTRKKLLARGVPTFDPNRLLEAFTK